MMNTTQTMAALFDFDGVVMDTESQYSIFWSEQGRRYHPGIENFDRLIKGQTLVQIYGKYFAGMEKEQKLIILELERFEQSMRYEYVRGVERFITELRANGVKTAVVTSSNNIKMNHVIGLYPEMETYFDYILTAEYFTNSKPNPECFLTGAKLLDTLPKNCVVFEDSFHGLEAGRRAGMTVIGLSTTNAYETICDKASLVIPDFEEFTFDRMTKIKSCF